MTRELTERQRQLLAFLQAAEVPPTVRETCEHMGYAPTSPQAVHDALTALEKKGYIRRPEVTFKARMPVTILRPLPGVLSARNRVAMIRDVLEKLERVRTDVQVRGAPVGADAHQLLRVADRDALEMIGAIMSEQPGGAS